MSAQENFSILLVDDDASVVRVLNRILSEFGPIRFASSGREALRLANESVPDLMLLDVNMPELSGFEVCKAFKGDPALAAVPIIFITSYDNAELQAKALQLGAADFISKPPQAPVVLARVRTFHRMKLLSDTLQGAAKIDFLTGAVTRHQFEKCLKQEGVRALRSTAPLAVLLADIEGFTAYNSEFGEEGGDACLRAVADALRLAAGRPTDILGRYAGGKFVILLPETDAQGAGTVARRAIGTVDALQIPRSASCPDSFITISMGVAYRDYSHATHARPLPGAAAPPSPEAALHDGLIAAAEQALARARSAGSRQAEIVEIADLEDSPVPHRRR